MLPHLVSTSTVDRRFVDSKSSSNGDGCLFACSNFVDQFICEFGFIITLTKILAQAEFESVLDILLCGDVLKVQQRVVGLVAVFVISLFAVWQRPKKCLRDESMNVDFLLDVVPTKNDLGVAISRRFNFADAVKQIWPWARASDTAKVGYFVQMSVFGNGNRQPSFVHVGWNYRSIPCSIDAFSKMKPGLF